MTAPIPARPVAVQVPEPCTTRRAAVRHLSLRLRYTGVMPGRVGMTLCGRRDAMDQPRLAFVVDAVPLLAALPLCRNCERVRIRCDLPAPADERPADEQAERTP